MADRVIVNVSTDEFNQGKGKRTIIAYDQRASIVEAISYVGKVIPESNWEQKPDDLQAYDFDLFVMGKDWCAEYATTMLTHRAQD